MSEKLSLSGEKYIAEKGDKRIEYKFKHEDKLILMLYNENTILKDLKPLIKIAKKLKNKLIEATELEHATKDNINGEWKKTEVFDYVTNQLVGLRVRQYE